MPKEMTVTQLERMLERKRRHLESLIQRRNKLRRELAQLEARIVAVGGAPSEERKPRRGRKRPKNTKTLLAAVSEVLSQNKKGVPLKELAAKILEGGYKTASENFENTIYQIIYNNRDKVAHDPKTKTYRLK
ncbi:MAG TPA: hypothetical protein VL475_14535 [Planctomycetaceae bacterium]|jgi:hypothetical protein|nr:hypothetical protein [Planctomycetaceae bacterium]